MAHDTGHRLPVEPQAIARGYQPDPGVRIRAFVIVLAIFAAFGILLWMLLWGTLHGLESIGHNAETAQRSPLATTQPIPPQPWLQPSPAQGDRPRQPFQDFQAFRQQENQKLESYGTLDAAAGTVRIPIESAMKMLAERAAPTSRPAGGAR